jgi:hypothetical protein
MRYTRHGKARAAERGISEEMIRAALAEPTCVYYDLSTGATVIFKKLDGKHLLVVYSKEGDEIKVVTTFITSVAQELIDRKVKGNVWVRVR